MVVATKHLWHIVVLWIVGAQFVESLVGLNARGARPQARNQELLWLNAGELSVAVNQTSGLVVWANASSGWSSEILAESQIGSARAKVLKISTTQLERNTIRVFRQLRVVGETSNGSCCATYHVFANDTFSLSGPRSVRWHSSFRSDAAQFWRTQISIRVSLLTPELVASSKWWISRAAAWWPGITESEFDVLRMLNATETRRLALGGRSYSQELSPPENLQSAPIPLSLHGVVPSKGGLGFVLSPNQTILNAVSNASAAGVVWERHFDRLGQGAGAVNTAAHIVFSEASDWRGVLGFTRSAFPEEFGAKATTKTLDAIGLGAYSCANVADMNQTRLDEFGGELVVWDAHFYWPFQGYSWPPAPAWRSNFGTGESTQCGPHFKHGEQVSNSLIRAEYAAADEANLTMLTYLNLNMWGKDMNQHWPLDPSSANSSAFMNASKVMAALFPEAALLPVKFGWQYEVILDPGFASWADFMFGQAEETKNRLGEHFRGFVIDEPHRAEFNLNPRAEDLPGVAWCGRPCSSMLLGWQQLAKRVQSVVHGNSTVDGRLLLTNFPERLDAMRYMDGIFTEANGAEADLEITTAGLLTAGGTSAIVWTVSSSLVTDAYLQKHLLFGVMPMAPIKGNDHSILPGNDEVDGLYRDYARLFRLLRRTRWFLDGSVTLRGASSSGAMVNAFEGEDRFVVVASLSTSSAATAEAAAAVEQAAGIGISVEGARFDPLSCRQLFLTKKDVVARPTQIGTTKFSFVSLVADRSLVFLVCGM